MASKLPTAANLATMEEAREHCFDESCCIGNNHRTTAGSMDAWFYVNLVSPGCRHAQPGAQRNAEFGQ
jgi:hypothetical protein